MSNPENSENGKKKISKSFIIMIAAASAVIVFLAVMIAVVSNKQAQPSKTQDPVSVLTPDGSKNTGAPGTAQPTEYGTPEPTVVPTEIPTETPEPTEIPTEIPTPTEEPSPTLPPPTETPTPKPRVVDGKTSANPEYEGKRIVCLTFDDGPQAGSTEYMLDVLKKHGARATFFVVGTQMAYGPNGELTTRAAQEGHQIGNHSYNHPNLSKLSDEKLLEERDKNADLIEKLTGTRPTVFRIPGGARTQRVRQLINQPIAMWNIDPLDWKFFNSSYIQKYAKENGISYDEAESRIIDIILFEGIYTDLDGEYIFSPPVAYEMKHGSILLFHDIYPASAKAVDRLLTFLEQEYGNFVYLPFDEFILTENDTIKPVSVYYTLWRTTD